MITSQKEEEKEIVCDPLIWIFYENFLYVER